MELGYARLDAGSVDQILELQQRCWAYDKHIFIPSSRALVERAFQFENFAFGAFSGGEMAGFITCSVPGHLAKMNLGRHLGFSDGMLDRVGHFNTMIIAPEHRKKGVGSRLFQMALETFPERVDCFMTTTRLENVLARQLLESRGFRLEKIIESCGQPRAIYALEVNSADD